MGKPIEDIRGPQTKNQDTQFKNISSNTQTVEENNKQSTVFQNTSVKSLEENDRTEINNINSEIQTNPFLMRYARHGKLNEDFGAVTPHSRTPRKIKFLWVIAIFAVIFAFASLSLAFDKATVIVQPKSFTLSVDTTYNAKYQSSSGISFEKMSVEKTETGNVTSSSTISGDIPSTGKVKLYNEYTTVKQNLLINTRLEAPNGKIYMTDTAVSIPGYTKKGDEIIPGSVEVNVHAEKGGADYNGGPTDFVIYGWKNDPNKSKKFYGRSTTSLSGGSTGLVYTVSDEEYEKKMEEMRIALQQKILTQLHAEVPEGFITFDDAIVIETVERTYDHTNTEVTIPLSISMKGTAFILSKQSIVEVIRASQPESIDVDDTVLLAMGDMNDANLIMSTENKLVDTTVLSVQITGTVVLVAEYDQSKFLADIVGVKIKNIPNIISNNQALESIKVKMRPPWKQTFPSKPSHIEIVQLNESTPET